MENFVTNALRLTFPRLAPHTQSANYIKSTEHLKEANFRSYEWDKPRHDPEFHFTAANRIFENTKEALKERRELAKQQKLSLEAQWRDLQDQEETFKDTFKKMSSFLRSNQDKRQRAEMICKEDRALRMQRDAQVEQLQEDLVHLTTAKKKIDEQIDFHFQYKKYLDEVIAQSQEFKDPFDVISRYESLVATKNELAFRQQKAMEETEAARAKTTKMIEDYKMQILGLNNTIADLQSRHSSAFQKALRWENVVFNIRYHCYNKFQEFNEVKKACWNIYLLMCKRRKETPKLAEEDFEGQLQFVKKTLKELSLIKRRARKAFRDSGTARVLNPIQLSFKGRSCR